MFEALRSRLVGAWKDLHARGLPSLFVFELIVVTLGVLLAQALAGWVGEREADKRLSATLVGVDRDVQNLMHAAEAWQMAMPCFRERIGTVMTMAGEGKEVPTDLLLRPALRNFPQQEVGLDGMLLLRERGEGDRARLYDSLSSMSEAASEAVGNVGDHWLALAVLDPTFGPVSAADRANARHDGAQLLSAMRRIEVVSKYIISEGRDLGLSPKPYQDARTAKDCAEIWARADMTPDPREDS